MPDRSRRRQLRQTGPGETHPPDHLCDPIEDTATLRAIIGPPLGTGASPFVDDNKGPDGAQ
ncbi:MAG TPA: hypothetical protein VNV39_07295, partial [Stellaceae bacterium]|nr:hypothetical protein [Stellaceae bacterium]